MDLRLIRWPSRAGTLAVRMRAGAGAEPVLLLHGLGASHAFFLPAAAGKALAGRPVILPDLPGHGDSQDPAGFSCAMEDLADLLLELLDGLGLRRVSLVGHSMGGTIALHMAERDPGRFTGLLFAEGNLRPEDATLSRRLAAMGAEGVRAELPRLVGQLAGSGLGGREDDLLYAATLSRCAPDVLWRYAAELVRTSDTPGLLERFLHLPVPRTYVYGERTPGLEPLLESLRSHGVPIRMVPGAGHSMMVERPDVFDRILREHLAPKGC